MIVKDLFEKCKTEDIVRELLILDKRDEYYYIFKDYMDGYKHKRKLNDKLRYKLKKLKESRNGKNNYTFFIDKVIRNLIPSLNTEYIFLARTSFSSISYDDDFYESHIEVDKFNIEELIKSFKLNKDIEGLRDVFELSSEDADKYLNILGGKHDDRGNPIDNIIPSSYAFEFDEWEDILGYKVYEKNIEKYGIAKVLAIIVSEMTFFGMSRTSKNETMEELDKSAKEVERIMELPKEERDSLLVEWKHSDFELPESNETEDTKKFTNGLILRESLYGYWQSYKEIRDNWFEEYLKTIDFNSNKEEN